MPLNLKRSVAVFFLLIFLFNVGGYHFLFWALKSNAKADLLHRLDADVYSSEDVVILTLPLSLPYPIHDPGYERADGEVEFGGEFYHMVKQKVENDTIFMVCIRDVEQKRIQKTINEYINFAGNLPADAKKAIDHLGKLFKDYTAVFSSGISKPLAMNFDLLFADDSFEIMQHPLTIDSPPPELG
jgi:hypothetical protein